jgi:hypothetical protein
MAKVSMKKEEQKMTVHVFSTKGEQGRKQPTHIDIERRAYEIYLMRGRLDGHADDDWLQAEKELLNGRNELNSC